MADDSMIAALRAMGQQADDAGAANDSSAEQPERAQPEPQPEPTEKAPAQDAEPEKPEASPDPTDKAEKDTDSPYTRAEKSKERLEKTWAQVNAEKAALQKERAELEALRAQQQPPTQDRQQQQQPAAPVKDQTGRTAADYNAAAEQFEQEGELDLAKLARTRGESLRQQEAQAAEAQQVAAARGQWMESVNNTLAKRPELGDPAHPLSQQVAALLKENPVFAHIPDGFRQAVEVAEARQAAGRVTTLEKETASLRKQLDEAQRKLAPNSSGTSLPSGGAKSLDAMGRGQRTQTLLAMARELDAGD